MEVGGEAKFGQQLSHLVIALVQMHPQGVVRGQLRPCHGETLDGLPSHLVIMAIRGPHGEAEQQVTTVGEPAALGANLAAVGRVLAYVFPPDGGLWSSPRPSRATPSQSAAKQRMSPSRATIRSGRRPTPCGSCRTRSHSRPWGLRHSHGTPPPDGGWEDHRG
jgi:hypothetical protein